MKSLIISVAALALLAGCNSHTSETYGKVDGRAKTITVPAGSSGLKGKIKKELANAGWQMKVYGGPRITEGYVGGATQLAQYDTFNTRYTLHMISRPWDICITGGNMVRYELSLIDNKTGSEVVTMDGNGCEPKIAKDFVSKL